LPTRATKRVANPRYKKGCQPALQKGLPTRATKREKMMILDRYTQFGGVNPETATITNVLASQGLTAPHTGRPFSEAMLFGIAGGIGCGYILWEFKAHDAAILVMGFQYKWNYTTEFMQNLSDRLGVQATFLESAGAKKAEQHLGTALGNGQAAVAWVDQEGLPYFYLRPMYNGCFGHFVSVYGMDDTQVYVDDRARKPLAVGRDAFAKARGRIGSYKNRLLLLDSAHAKFDLPAAIRAGIADCVDYIGGDSQTFAIPVYKKWARLMTDTKNKKGWPVVFKEKKGLYSTLRSLHEGIKHFGTKGGGLRYFYADFLNEAAAVVGNQALEAAAAHYTELGDRWKHFADAVLPDHIAPLAETRQIEAQKYAVFLEQGNDGLDEVAELSQQLSDLEEELNSQFPISDDDMHTLFAEMQSHLEGIYEAEREAHQALKACLN
jgi:hypothetical protein